MLRRLVALHHRKCTERCKVSLCELCLGTANLYHPSSYRALSDSSMLDLDPAYAAFTSRKFIQGYNPQLINKTWILRETADLISLGSSCLWAHVIWPFVYINVLIWVALMFSLNQQMNAGFSERDLSLGWKSATPGLRLFVWKMTDSSLRVGEELEAPHKEV